MRVAKILVLLAVLACALLLSSCSGIEFNAENLMNAPTLTDEQNKIRDALYDALGTNSVKFKYPKAGEYRSAFVMHDMDGDGKDEAMVFYDPQLGDSNVRVNILTQTDSGWISTYDIGGKGSNIDSVDFCKMTSTEKEDIVIAWNQAGGNDKTVTVFAYEEGQLVQQSSDWWFNEKLLYDVNKDGLIELLLLRCNLVSGEASARLVSFSNGELKSGSAVPLNNSISSFAKVQVGMLSSNTEAIFVDSLLDSGEYITDILKCDSSGARTKIINVLDQLPDEAQISTNRKLKVYCEDINKDGVMEVPYMPTPSYLPGYDDSIDSDKMYSAQYVRWTGTEFEPLWYGVINVDAGYRFEYPEEWIDVVTVKQQMETGEWKFIVYDQSLDNDFQQLLRLRTNNKGRMKDKFETENYKLLGERGIYEYMAFIPPDVEVKGLQISYQEVEERFALLP
ncbi:hypothetical protein [Hydrogenoanaerobacterium sp.]|uniref:hypothetical protein n=1 Tax=Hydrogenoanaerobacterium sp. TaxID=2953763 RepID=UPI00289E73DC|nr:hypothetical protein [Hydrogenoanaerobacterium sp.]